MLGDSAYDIFEWNDFLLAQGVVTIAPYNTRNTDDALDIEYRVEDRPNEHAEDISLKQSILAEMYDHWTQVDTDKRSVQGFRPRHVRARGRVHARTQVFVAVCLRVIVAITNYERGHNLGRTNLKTL